MKTKCLVCGETATCDLVDRQSGRIVAGACEEHANEAVKVLHKQKLAIQQRLDLREAA